MINLILGMLIGIILAESGCTPIIKEYLIELYSVIYNFREY